MSFFTFNSGYSINVVERFFVQCCCYCFCLIVLEGSQLVKMKSALVLILLGVCEKAGCQCYVDSC